MYYMLCSNHLTIIRFSLSVLTILTMLLYFSHTHTRDVSYGCYSVFQIMYLPQIYSLNAHPMLEAQENCVQLLIGVSSTYALT